MPDFLPEGKTCILVKTHGIPGCRFPEVIYEFRIDCRNLPYVLEIPGEYRGPDNCEASSKEQEKWLDELGKTGIERVWYCQWQIIDKGALEKFLQILEPYKKETAYY